MPDEQPTPANLPPPHYKPWVGVVLSFLVTGLGPFVAGKKKQGLAWFVFLVTFGLLWIWSLGAASAPVTLALWVQGGIGFTLWILMLRQSYLPVPRFKKSLWLLVGGLVALTGFVEDAIARQLTQAFKIPTGAMSPTLQGRRQEADGSSKSADHVLVSRCAYWFGKPQRGDVVVFRTDGIDQMNPSQQGQLYVKRIVGLPGDRISIQDGKLMNNGIAVTAPAIFAKLKYEFVGGQYLRQEGQVFELPADSYFVVGDNSINSYDSRFWGPVPSRNVIGRATRIYWPPERAGRIE